MLRITVAQVKKQHKEVFYANNDFSQPDSGAHASVITSYEKCERGHFGLTGKPKKDRKTSMQFYDSSNAFNTFKREFLVENLQLAGSARQILCRALVRQNKFQVKTNKSIFTH